MVSTVIYIRHMVCSKCILVVREQLVEMGLVPLRVELGEVEVAHAAEFVDWPRLRQSLQMEGFELLNQQSVQQRLVEAIKATIAEMLATDPDQLRSGHFSRALSTRLAHRYSFLSDAFSSTVGCNLELYVIRQRVKAAQLLLTTTTLAVGRIARQLGYSNLGHLSRQFQREMGCSPSEYRRAHSADKHAPLITGEADIKFAVPDIQPNLTNNTSPSPS